MLNMCVFVCLLVNFLTLSSGFPNVIQDIKGHQCKQTFSKYFWWISANCTLTTVFLSPCQLTMEKLCRLRPLHSGFSPAVLRDLQWPEISEAAHCQCWRTLLTELKPGHRAMLYNAMQEVMLLLSAFSTSHITFLCWMCCVVTCWVDWSELDEGGKVLAIDTFQHYHNFYSCLVRILKLTWKYVIQ